MFKNYLKIAIRRLVKEKLYFVINVSSLGIGIATSLLLLFYIQNELNYDRHFKEADRICRINQKFKNSNNHLARCSPAFAKNLENEFPEIDNVVRIKQNKISVLIDDRKFKEDKLFYVDSSFFKIFSYNLKQGNLKTALKEPYSVVITEDIAKKYFGDKNPLDQSIILSDDAGSKEIYRITGVMPKIKRNSHFNFDILASFSSLNKDSSQSFNDVGGFTYIKLNKNQDHQKLEERMPYFLTKYYGEDITSVFKLCVQPILDIHLRSNLQGELEKNGSIKMVTMFGIIAFLILFIASVNFINLTTARSALRAKEIGVRKVLGAYRSNINKQFFGETVVLNIIVLIITLILLCIFIKPFNEMVDMDLKLFSFDYGYIYIELILLIIITGIISGIYPALVLSSYKPVETLKGVQSGKKGSLLRKILIVFQYTISSSLIIGLLVISEQMKYIEKKDIGITTDNIISTLEYDYGTIDKKYKVFKNELIHSSTIVDVTSVMSPPSNKILDRGLVDVAGFDYNTKNGPRLEAVILPVQNNFPDFMSMEFIAGKTFNDIEYKDTISYIINESLMKQIGWNDPSEAIGKLVAVNNLGVGRVLGVVKDFNFSSLHDKVDPVVLFVKQDWLFTILVKYRNNLESSIAQLKTAWEKIYPDVTLEYNTVKSLYENLYKQERNQFKAISYFSMLAIIISCLGLFGLLSFIVQQKYKEIGIRKVQGASVLSIIILFYKNFLQLAIIGNLIAFPIGYYVMNKWLNDFAYHIEIKFWIFILGFIITVIITAITIGYHTFKAATVNPVESLKYE